MKKLIIAVAMLAIAAVPADAQAFLNKMKEKAAGAVGNAIGGNIKNVLGEKAKDYMPEEVKNMAEMSETM